MRIGGRAPVQKTEPKNKTPNDFLTRFSINLANGLDSFTTKTRACAKFENSLRKTHLFRFCIFHYACVRKKKNKHNDDGGINCSHVGLFSFL